MPSSSSTTSTTPEPPTTESKNQFYVALAIVFTLGTLGLAMIGAALMNPSVGTAIGIGTALGTILGILGNALMAPSGIGRVLAAAAKTSPNSGQTNVENVNVQS